MPLAPGDRLGPYEILSPLGAGGMGEVWKARDTRLNREVAIKISNEKFTDRFEREAKSIAALNHPNICQLYDVGPNYLVMELIEGAPLKGPLPLDQALKYGAQICDALDAAHRKGIAHRDLKPANILVTKSGVKLLDFGIAKQTGPLKETDATRAITQDGAIVGTINYMSPEQLQSKEAGTRSDIFSFGLVMYEMLTGKRAFEGANTASVIAAILERPAPSVAEIAPPALDRVLKTCLAKDPDDRWQSARDLKRELEWIASAQQEPTPVEPARSAWRFWAVALTVVAAVLIAAGAGWFLHRPPPSAPRLKLHLDVTSGTLFSSATLLSPGGTMIAFSDEKSVYVRAVDSLEDRLIDKGPAAIVLAWSPDSRWVLVSENNELRKIPVVGGASQTIASGLLFSRGAAWASDGTILFSAAGPVLRVSENGGTPTPVTTEAGFYPTLLPDGRHFLFLGPGSAIYLASLDSKEKKRLTEANSKAELSPSGHLLFLRGTTLMAQPFDISALRITGEAAPIVSDVALYAVSRSAQFTVAKNGLILYQTGGIGRSALTWFDRSGKALGVLDDTNFHEDIQLSPDGSLLAATRRDPKTLERGLWITDLARGIATRVTSEDEDMEFPAWSPDGKRIAFNSGPGSAGSLLTLRDLYVREMDSGKTERVTRGVMPAWAPDGSALMFTRRPPDAGALLVRLDGDRKPVAYLQGDCDQASFSPDGRWVAYASDESGDSQVYVQSFPAGHGKWQISKRGGAQPVWRHDGRELFYREPNSLGGKIFAVPVSTGATFEPGVAKELFAVLTFGINSIRRQYAVTPDGQKFLVNVTVDVPRETILLQNWLTPEHR